MGQQDEGADSVTLLDPASKTVLSLKAGDDCADFAGIGRSRILPHGILSKCGSAFSEKDQGTLKCATSVSHKHAISQPQTRTYNAPRLIKPEPVNYVGS